MMIYLIFALLLNVHSPTEGGKISVEITGLRNNKGQICISFFKDGKGYYDKPDLATHSAIIPIINGKAIYTSPNLPYGNYAAVAIHDENKSEKMDFALLGYPIEGIAISNNAIGRFWQIKDFEAAKVTLNNSNLKMPLKMVY